MTDKSLFGNGSEFADVHVAVLDLTGEPVRPTVNDETLARLVTDKRNCLMLKLGFRRAASGYQPGIFQLTMSHRQGPTPHVHTLRIVETLADGQMDTSGLLLLPSRDASLDDELWDAFGGRQIMHPSLVHPTLEFDDVLSAIECHFDHPDRLFRVRLPTGFRLCFRLVVTRQPFATVCHADRLYSISRVLPVSMEAVHIQQVAQMPSEPL